MNLKAKHNLKYEWKHKIKTGKHQENIILTNHDPPMKQKRNFKDKSKYFTTEKKTTTKESYLICALLLNFTVEKSRFYKIKIRKLF